MELRCLLNRYWMEMSRNKDRRNLTHINVYLPDRSVGRLRELMNKTEAGTYSEVFSDALKLYEAILNDITQGSEIIVRQQDGSLVPYRIVL